jgi:hypothetical protein
VAVRSGFFRFYESARCIDLNCKIDSIVQIWSAKENHLDCLAFTHEMYGSFFATTLSSIIISGAFESMKFLISKNVPATEFSVILNPTLFDVTRSSYMTLNNLHNAFIENNQQIHWNCMYEALDGHLKCIHLYQALVHPNFYFDVAYKLIYDKQNDINMYVLHLKIKN